MQSVVAKLWKALDEGKIALCVEKVWRLRKMVRLIRYRFNTARVS